MEKIYLAGPMSGLPDLNFPAFFDEAARLRELGYEVVNPAELNNGITDWHKCLRRDLMALLSCDTLLFLPGWENSKGVHLEMHVAHQVRIPIAEAARIKHPHPLCCERDLFPPAAGAL